MTNQGTTEQVSGGEIEIEVADWKRAHTELVRLAALRASLDWDEGRLLLSALRFGVHLKLGMGSFFEYVERLFGYSRRMHRTVLGAQSPRATDPLQHSARPRSSAAPPLLAGVAVTCGRNDPRTKVGSD